MGCESGLSAECTCSFSWLEHRSHTSLMEHRSCAHSWSSTSLQEDTALLKHVAYHPLVFRLPSSEKVGVYKGRFLLPKDHCDSGPRRSSSEAEGGFANGCELGPNRCKSMREDHTVSLIELIGNTAGFGKYIKTRITI